MAWHGRVLSSECQKSEIKVLAGPTFYLEALKEKSTSKLVLIVGRIQLFVAVAPRFCFLAGRQPGLLADSKGYLYCLPQGPSVLESAAAHPLLLGLQISNFPSFDQPKKTLCFFSFSILFYCGNMHIT